MVVFCTGEEGRVQVSILTRSANWANQNYCLLLVSVSVCRGCTIRCLAILPRSHDWVSTKIETCAGKCDCVWNFSPRRGEAEVI